MILYFALMAVMIWVVLSVGLWKLASAHAHEVEHELNLSTRPGSRPKAVPPFPFGTISDLVRDAERQAEEDFYAQFPEERPTPFTGSAPGGYSMDSGPHGIIVSNGTMTPNELRERFLDQSHGPMMVLPESVEYHAIHNPPKMADVGTVDKPYQRYIEGIGIISAESEHKLERACEVVLTEEFEKSAAMMRALDERIKSVAGVPPPMSDLTEVREKRHDEWEKCKLYLGLLQELNQ